LPENICDECLQDLLICCNFRKLIRKSDGMLVKMFGKSTNIIANNTVAPEEIYTIADTSQNSIMEAELGLFHIE
jgi:hypothetical protein